MYRDSHPDDPLKSTQLQIMTSSSVRYGFPAEYVFHVGEQKNGQMVPNQENMEGDQPVQRHSHTQQPLQRQTCVQEHCPGETGLPSFFQAVWTSALVRKQAAYKQATMGPMVLSPFIGTWQ